MPLQNIDHPASWARPLPRSFRRCWWISRFQVCGDLGCACGFLLWVSWQLPLCLTRYLRSAWISPAILPQAYGMPAFQDYWGYISQHDRILSAGEEHYYV